MMIMMITTTAAISRVLEELELVVVDVAGMLIEVCGGIPLLDEILLLEVDVLGTAEVVAATMETLSSDCIFKEPK